MLFGPKFACFVFSDSFLKIATAKPTTKGLKISYLKKKNLPAGAVNNNRIADVNLFKDALKNFFLENYDQIKTRKLVLGLNEQEVFLATVYLPEKPKDLAESIREKIASKLPFDSSQAAIFYQEISHGIYQVAATEGKILQTINTAFEEAGFSIKALLPIPLIFPRLVGAREAPYLFISSDEEDLIYTLVTKNGVAFTSTTKLKKALAESEKEIIKIAREIIEEEYSEKEGKPLNSVCLLGKDVGFLNRFFTSQNFDTEAISLTKLPNTQTGDSLPEFSRVLSLSFYDDSILAIQDLSSIKTEGLKQIKHKGGSSKLYLVSLLVVLAAVGLFFFWPVLKDAYWQLVGNQEHKEATPTATPTAKPKQATPPANNKEVTSGPTQKLIDKTIYKIQILNGSGKAGAASEVRDFLLQRGYNIVSLGNAINFNYQATQISVKAGGQEILGLLTNDLKEGYTVNTGLPLPEGSPFDIIIIIGGE